MTSRVTSSRRSSARRATSCAVISSSTITTPAPIATATSSRRAVSRASSNSRAARRGAPVLLDGELVGRARHRLEVADLGAEEDPLHLRMAPGLQRRVGLGVERHERVEGRRRARRAAPARAARAAPSARPRAALGALRRCLERRPAAPAVVAVGGLPAVHVGDRELQLERERLPRAGARWTSSKRSPSVPNAASATPIVTSGPSTVSAIAASSFARIVTRATSQARQGGYRPRRR